MFRAQTARLPHLEQEVEEGGGGIGNPEVRPRGVVEVVDLPLLPSLQETSESNANRPKITQTEIQFFIYAVYYNIVFLCQ